MASIITAIFGKSKFYENVLVEAPTVSRADLAVEDELDTRRRYACEEAKVGAAISVAAMHREHHHNQIIRSLSGRADAHMMRVLLRWCEMEGVFLHPALWPEPAIGDKQNTFRDHVWHVTTDVPSMTPLLAIPERLCIGFKDTESEDDIAALKRGTTEAAKGSVDDTAAAAEESDGDVCAFFFTAIGLLVNDLLVALNNEISDKRFYLAKSLQRIRTCHNAPYLSTGYFQGAQAEPPLAEVFLQMVHNYVQAGPLTGKVERDMLNWAVSVSLSHSTPLTIAGRKSIGIVPVLHLFPHGNADVNAVPVTRGARAADGARLRRLFRQQCSAMPLSDSEEYVYLVTTRALAAGSTVAVQAMAPVCHRSEEAEDMWRLTCGAPPPEESVGSLEYQEVLRSVNEHIREVAAALGD
jgi:hypothetical protein